MPEIVVHDSQGVNKVKTGLDVRFSDAEPMFRVLNHTDTILKLY